MLVRSIFSLIEILNRPSDDLFQLQARCLEQVPDNLGPVRCGWAEHVLLLMENL